MVETLADIGETLLLEFTEVEQQDFRGIEQIEDFRINVILVVHHQVKVVAAHAVADGLVEKLLTALVEIEVDLIVGRKVARDSIVQLVFERAVSVEQQQNPMHGIADIIALGRGRIDDSLRFKLVESLENRIARNPVLPAQTVDRRKRIARSVLPDRDFVTQGICQLLDFGHL